MNWFIQHMSLLCTEPAQGIWRPGENRTPRCPGLPVFGGRQTDRTVGLWGVRPKGPVHFPHGCSLHCFCLGMMIKTKTVTTAPLSDTNVQQPLWLACCYSITLWEHGGTEKFRDLASLTQPGKWQNAAPPGPTPIPFLRQRPLLTWQGQWVYIPQCISFTRGSSVSPHSSVIHTHLPTHVGTVWQC